LGKFLKFISQQQLLEIQIVMERMKRIATILSALTLLFSHSCKQKNISAMNQKEKIQLYYKCMGEKIKEPLYEILHPDLVFLSQYAVYKSRDTMIEDIWPHVGKTQAQELEIFGDEDKFMVKYKILHQRNMTMSEYIEFKDDKISKIEVYMGFELK
jgi:hypothetical protein